MMPEQMDEDGTGQVAGGSGPGGGFEQPGMTVNGTLNQALGSQYIAEKGDIHIVMGAPLPEPITVLASARQALRQKAYKVALDRCTELLDRDVPAHYAEAHLLAAMALLEGETSARLTEGTLRKVESHLLETSEDPVFAATAWMIWGLVRYDYYFLNSLSMGQPSLSTIRHRLAAFDPDSADRDLLQNVSATPDAWRYFRGE